MTKDETKPITRYNFQGEWLVSDWLISAKDKEIISWRKISERRAQEIVNKNKEIKLNEEGWNKCASKNFMLNQEIAELELYIRNMAQQIMEQSKEIKRQIQDHGKTMELLDARNKEIEELKKNISVWEITSKEETSKIIAEIINKATEIADLKKENEEHLITKFADAWKKVGTQHDWFWCRKKPVIVKAIQMDIDFEVATLEGNHKGKAGDYLLEGVRGEVYPCKKEIFEETYKRIKRTNET